MMIVVSRPPVSAAAELLYPHTGWLMLRLFVVVEWSSCCVLVTIPAAMCVVFIPPSAAE